MTNFNFAWHKAHNKCQHDSCQIDICWPLSGLSDKHQLRRPLVPAGMTSFLWLVGLDTNHFQLCRLDTNSHTLGQAKEKMGWQLVKWDYNCVLPRTHELRNEREEAHDDQKHKARLPKNTIWHENDFLPIMRWLIFASVACGLTSHVLIRLLGRPQTHTRAGEFLC